MTYLKQSGPHGLAGDKSSTLVSTHHLSPSTGHTADYLPTVWSLQNVCYCLHQADPSYPARACFPSGLICFCLNSLEILVVSLVPTLHGPEGFTLTCPMLLVQAVLSSGMFHYSILLVLWFFCLQCNLNLQTPNILFPMYPSLS